MTRRKLGMVVGLLAVVATCGAVLAAGKTLYRKASPFTTIVVTENDGGVRTLWFGDGDAPQSVVKVGDPDYVELDYAQAMPVAMALVEEPKRVLIVGLGGGTIPSLLHKHYPKMAIDVVDIDPDVVEVAKKYFGFREDATMRVHVEDGRRFIERCKEPYDIIFLDAYGPDNIPYDLATKEFLLAARRAVKPKGLVAANVWSSFCNPLYDAMLRTYQEAFDDLYVIEAADSGNEIFLALPRQERIERGDLASRASRISKQKKLRFDMGTYVRAGFLHAREKNPRTKVLLDQDKMPELAP
ncbi:MAG: spermidine synthase [Pirellulales bacterium]